MPQAPAASPAALGRVHIVTKTGHAGAAALGREIAAWLAGRGVIPEVVEHCRRAEGPTERENAGDAPHGRRVDRPDLYLVLGGDGTLLSVARRTLGEGVPLLGVNLGTLGFLAKATPADWQATLERALADGMAVEERMALECSVWRSGQEMRRGMAVNDLVVSRGAMARLIRMALACGGERVMDVRADGLIVSSPTGTTAYAVSAGGPAIHPRLSAFGVTVICPFPGALLRAMVLPADLELEVHVLESVGEVYLTEDGQNLFRLQAGDRVGIRRSAHNLRLMAVSGDGYFAALREKGFVRG